MVFQSWKNGVKSSLNFERSQLSPWAKIKKSEATFCRSTLLLSFCENRLCLSQLIKKLNSTERGALFDIFVSPRWSPLRMRTKVVSFFIFFQELSNKNKIKALRPKMTKIASMGGGGGGGPALTCEKRPHMSDSAKNTFRWSNFSFAGTRNERSSRLQAPLGMVMPITPPRTRGDYWSLMSLARARACVKLCIENFWTKPGKWDHLRNRTTYSQSLRWS